MKIYFEKFVDGEEVSYLTPGKLYEVVDHVGDVLVRIKDDVGDEIMVGLNGGHHCSPWKVSPEETSVTSVSEAVAALESERNALANSIDSVNELLDNLSVPKEETLRERVYLLYRRTNLSTEEVGKLRDLLRTFH